MTTFFMIGEIKAANKAAGDQWFTPKAMSFFGSRVFPRIFGGHFFVTSERVTADSRRFYTVRYADDNGKISTVGDFMRYYSLTEAYSAAKGYALNVPDALYGHPWDEIEMYVTGVST